MTTCITDVAPNVKSKRKKRPLPKMFSTNLQAAIEDVVDEVLESAGGRRTGERAK